MLPWGDHLFGGSGPKPSQGSVPAGPIQACDFGFCFQCQVGSSVVLRRPIEITALIGHVNSGPISLLCYRVPGVYLSSEFVPVLSLLPERRINNLRRVTGRRWSESHPLRQPFLFLLYLLVFAASLPI